jgi:hypothetical protein
MRGADVARAPITKRVEKWPTTPGELTRRSRRGAWHCTCPYTLRNQFSSDHSMPAQLAVWRETVSIDRNIANDIELAVTVSSYFADTGSWLIHILTVIWGS